MARQRDGVVIRGAKLHITGASLGHDLLTIPTKAMKPGEEEWSIRCVVPVNAPGVKIINTTYAPRHEDTRAFPVSGNEVDGEYRSRLTHAIPDLTADAYGGWKAVTNIQAGAGLYAQRIGTRKHYDLDAAKRKALAVAGLVEDQAH